MDKRVKKRRRRNTKKRKINRVFFFSVIFIVVLSLIFNKNKDRNYSEPVDYRDEYINMAKPIAIKVAKKYDLFPSVVLAQSALESSWGTSGLSSDYNNYFGIKSNSSSNSKDLMTSEFVKGKEIKINQPFREYTSINESFEHYGLLIGTAPRYEAVRDAKDYKEAAYAIKKCGYATDPKYAEKIIIIIESHDLNELD